MQEQTSGTPSGKPCVSFRGPSGTPCFCMFKNIRRSQEQIPPHHKMRSFPLLWYGDKTQPSYIYIYIWPRAVLPGHMVATPPAGMPTTYADKPCQMGAQGCADKP